MKASIKFREDRPPLVRAKIPIGVLGLPFLSGVAASAGDDPRELRLDLATAFHAGPSLRLSYRPNDSRNPFSLVLKTGVGALGSPAGGSPLAMSAEFGLLGGRPTFSLLLKPRFGDFTLKKSVDPAATSQALEVKVAHVGDTHAVDPPIMEFGTDKGVHAGRKLNGFPIDISTLATGSRSGIEGLLSGFEVTARSVFQLPKRTAVQFKWGLRVPPELRTAIDDPTVPISVSKIPLLVMNKISIERMMDDQISKETKPVATEASDACTLLKREVETLKTESGLLRRAVEELNAEVGRRKATAAAAPLSLKRDNRSDSKSTRNLGKSESLNEELMKPPVMS
ncbi:hypothetical protein Cni_G25996 [Canna indica]|uniref:Uncharacterized protein n=1 Tax=Canna indica TaxID=4628 RepID=A0AAQ3L5B2_9LILI|nr:hypothetical protein Cni_G25996 [Canna indica]